MGGDGGSIPGRADVVRTAGMRFARNLGGMGYLPNTQVIAGSEKYDKLEEKKLRWTTCSLSQEPLDPPLVGCRLGQLYNKEALLYRLSKRKTMPLPPNMSHISSRKNVKDLVIDFNKVSKRLVCPILKVEFDAGVKGVLLWNCGCVVSAKALDELSPIVSLEDGINRSEQKQISSGSIKKTRSRICPVCETVNLDEDIVVLVPDISIIPDIRAKLLLRQEEEKQSRKKLKTERVSVSATS